MARVLLLNPPGDELFLRDYYCSKVSKADYVYQPVDLVVMSGAIGRDSHEIAVIDAIVDGIGRQECLAQAEAFGPDVILALTGAVSFEQDMAFFAAIKERLPGVRIAASGDILLEDGAKVLREQECLDAVIRDFSEADVANWVAGEHGRVASLIYRRDREIVEPAWSRPRGEFEIPAPRHELFLNPKYRHPFQRRRPMATVLTDYGCPFHCTFCVMSGLGYRWRSVDSVMEELRRVAALAVPEVYFDDQTFGAAKPRTLELLRRMAEADLKLTWFCFSRADVTDDAFLAAAKRAGCHTVVYGVESAKQDTLDKAQKGMTLEQIEAAFARCRKHGIHTAATFIVGLPDDTEADIRATIDLAKRLQTDYASFNVPVPRMATALRRQAIADGLVAADDLRMDQSGTYAVMGSRHLSKADVERLVREALWQFYLRPSYLWRRLVSIRSWYDLKRYFRSGLAVVRSIVSRFVRGGSR